MVKYMLFMDECNFYVQAKSVFQFLPRDGQFPRFGCTDIGKPYGSKACKIVQGIFTTMIRFATWS